MIVFLTANAVGVAPRGLCPALSQLTILTILTMETRGGSAYV